MSDEHMESRRTHENLIFACFGCMSNTGLIAGLASIEAVKEVGLERAGIGCLPSLPLEVPPAVKKAKAAGRIITVDGCPFECSRRTVEAAKFTPARSFVLTRDVGVRKMSLDRDVGESPLPLADYISQEDVDRTKRLLVKAVLEG